MWQPGWEGTLGENDTCICITESLRCSPETTTTLSISCTTIQNKKLKKNKIKGSVLQQNENSPSVCTPKNKTATFVWFWATMGLRGDSGLVPLGCWSLSLSSPEMPFLLPVATHLWLRNHDTAGCIGLWICTLFFVVAKLWKKKKRTLPISLNSAL